MRDIRWFANRIKAMSLREILWRVEQKILQEIEKNRFGKKILAVTDHVFRPSLKNLYIRPERLHLNMTNASFSTGQAIALLGGYDYEEYKRRWHAGFQTENNWPLTFSYSMDTAHMSSDIGDVRTNWELNRHFQFAILAKNYAATGEGIYLNELIELFDDWNRKNPFLWGISWTSPMEIAIRCSNWCYTYAFLASSENVPKDIRRRLEIGIVNMADYIANHYSRYSSANNHLIVEAYAIGQTGILTCHKPWSDLAVQLLTRELPRQNFADGVNKEQSLHYQAFSMEAVGLLVRLLVKNGENVPEIWWNIMMSNCRYLAACMGNHGEIIEFGDNDVGKVLDLEGNIDHYKYVKELYSLLVSERYADMETCSENINWLFTDDEREKAAKKEEYFGKECMCFREGGNTILRSGDKRVIIGIDHAPLGFGAIAAHGHADALSFQMFVNGHPLFVDSGTYLYSYDATSRNAYRKTINHNTACVEEKDQSEMLGPFLWGRRAECQLLNMESTSDKTVLAAQHDGYQPIIHKRVFEFDHRRTLRISDMFSKACDYTLSFVLAPHITAAIEGNVVHITSENCSLEMEFRGDSVLDLTLQSAMYSARYGTQERTNTVRVKAHGREISTKIMIWEEVQ